MSKPVGLRCPHCGSKLMKTIDSRKAPGGVRRRRVCMASIDCNGRFTTFEQVVGIGRPVRKKRGGEE